MENQVISGLRVSFCTQPERTPKITPKDIATALADQNMFVWHGHNYAYEPTRFLGLPEDEGVLRIGLAHYNTEAEVDKVLAALAELHSKSV